jgi:O-methyltransferase
MDGADAISYILNNNIEGVIVECGVDSGDFEYKWIIALMANSASRDIYLYDTFKGLVAPGEFDYTCNNAVIYNMDRKTTYDFWQKQIINETTNAWCYTPLNKVKERLYSTGYQIDKLFFIEGDVMDTLSKPENLPEKIAILRLDTDWYESSKYELEQLYDRVVTGGVIIFDDYYHWDGQRRATDEFFKNRNIEYTHVSLNNGKTSAIIKI